MDDMDVKVPMWVCELRRELDQREKRYMERMAAIEATLNLTAANAKLAVDKAESAANDRFESANNVKSEFAERLMMLMPRQEVTARMESVEKSIDDLTHVVSTMTGKSVGIKEGWGYLVGAAGLGAFLVSVLVK